MSFDSQSDDYLINDECIIPEIREIETNSNFTKLKKTKREKIVKEKLEQDVFKKKKKIEAVAVKPKEAIRNLRLSIDFRLKKLFDKKYGQFLQSIKDNCTIVEINDDEMLPIENSVCWSRRDPHDLEVYRLEEECCLILTHDNLPFSNDVDSVVKHTCEIRTRIPVDSKLKFLVVGNEFHKNLRLKEAFFESSLRTGVPVHYEPDLAGLGIRVADLSKSIAEKLHKKRTQVVLDFLSFAPGDQKISTKLTDDGVEGHRQCWRRMLQVMAGSKPNAENASKSIASVYKCPRALLNAYKEQLSVEHSESLLGSLVADPLTKVRVGPSISCCIYRSLMLNDPEVTVDKPKV